MSDHGIYSTGSAVVSTAGKLPFKGVIHAVGPRYGEGNEETMLEKALVSAFECAGKRGWSSVALPAVSSGFAVPPDADQAALFRASSILSGK